MAESPWVMPENLGLSQGQAKASSGDGHSLSLKEAKANFEAQLLVQTLLRYQGNGFQGLSGLLNSRSAIYHLLQKPELCLKKCTTRHELCLKK